MKVLLLTSRAAISLSALLGISGVALAAGPTANISDPNSLLGALSVSRGGATVASPTLHDALFQNPAGAAFSDNYAVTLGYLGVGDALTASIVDNKSGPVGGGLYYLRRDLKNWVAPAESSIGSYARMEERAGFSLFGKPAPGFGVGVNAKYSYRRSYDARYPNGKNWNGDVGAKYIVNDVLSVGLVGQNLLEDLSGMNPKSLAFGFEYRPRSNFAVSTQLTRFLIPALSPSIGWGLGGEYVFAEGFSVRSGYRDNSPWNEAFFGLGAGYKVKTFSFDYSAQIPTRGLNSSVLHSFGMTGLL